LGIQTVLRCVGRALEELNLVGSGAALRYYINITTGDAMSLAVFVDDERFFQVKVSEFLDLRQQYELYCRAWRDYPAFVPRPLGYRVLDEWNLMISEGVHHVAIRRSEVLRPRWRGAGVLPHQLCAYFDGGRDSSEGPAGQREQAELLSRLAAHFGASPLARVADGCLTRAVALGVESIPERRQHCDFVRNNLGRAGSRLVVFDWEDYATINLPGLDVCTLCLSLLGGGVEAVSAMMLSGRGGLDAGEVAFLRRACERQGIELEVFRQLVPLYLLVFLYLKRNYGSSVRQRIADLLCGLQLT
jgi:hypothetical protein